MIDDPVIFNWKFDWRMLYSQGVDRLTGYIELKDTGNEFLPQKIDVDLTKVEQNVTKSVIIENDSNIHLKVSFEYYLTPHYAHPKKVSYEDLFAPSDMNDTVLVVEGKKIHVNKVFLSYHSDYFKALFSKSFKEGSLSEIEIKEVSYDDFGLLCSSFYPSHQFPNDQTVEKLLEMSRRFLLPSVTKIVEHHLSHISKIAIPKKIWLADEYSMDYLLDKCIRQMDSMEKAKKLKELPEFDKLTDKTRSLILGRIMDFM
ncbi:hypothetical protein B9Z55_007663 [Caenorhabditis nigoni]|uniref:BTB domain-containing protein n=2 Tax=Caenorhabditis nigoni TaxID=1611254 RepID=A0A2G5VAX9_9PELO|nr:hypothetical protein B9Z55_007663 [Caenorhabditis nigoni]